MWKLYMIMEFRFDVNVGFKEQMKIYHCYDLIMLVWLSLVIQSVDKTLAQEECIAFFFSN
jgi:hypothetical protein